MSWKPEATIYLSYSEMFSMGCAVGYFPNSEWSYPGRPWNWGLPDGGSFGSKDPECEGWSKSRHEALVTMEEYALEILNPFRCQACGIVRTEHMAITESYDCTCGGKFERVKDHSPIHISYDDGF